MSTRRGYLILADISGLGQLLSIKQGEGHTATLVIGLMLSTAMGAALGGSGIEALFFARFGVEYLPYMFLGLGITSMLTSFGVSAALGRISRGVLYLALPVLLALLILGARFALLTKLNWLYPTLWLGKEVFNSLITMVIWGTAGAVFHTRQAKRLFPLFNASRILGQVIGGFATGLLVASFGAENLLLAWSAALLLAFVLSRALLTDRLLPAPSLPRSRRTHPTLLQEMQRGFQHVRGSPLFRWISFAAILFSVLYFSIALPFARAAAERFPNENDLASFLGLFNGLSTAAAFLASLFLANRLFARFGIMLCILAFPVIYLLGFGSLALAPLFLIIVAFRFAQMLWLAGVADPAWQTMFNIAPPERRDRVRTFVDGAPGQAGTFIAGGLLIIGEQALTPQQLYFIGLFAAALCTLAVYQARRGYNSALVEALRAGRPHLFFAEEQPFGGFRQDAAAARAALNGLSDPDPAIRRLSAEMLGHLSLPESTPTLVRGLSDADPLVRVACLRALAASQAASALSDIAASLRDPEPAVRFEAVSALSALAGHAHGLIVQLRPLLSDAEARVSTAAALALLRICDAKDEGFAAAKAFLRRTAALGDLPDRIHALNALGEWGDAEAFDFLADELRDTASPPEARRAAVRALLRARPDRALEALIDALADPDRSVRERAALALGEIGAPALESVLRALRDAQRAEGALLALERLPPPPARPILEFARAAVSRAVEYDGLRRGIRPEVPNDALSLLAESLHDKSQEYGIQALRAIGLLGDRATMNLAIENLGTRDAAQRANVLEALDSMSAKWRDVAQPLTALWEGDGAAVSAENWGRLLMDDDSWIRECAVYAHAMGDAKMETLATLSIMDRILFFKRVPLFANLSPADLKQVAAIAREEVFPDGEVLAHQGEAGDAMFVIVSGEVRVCTIKNGKEVEIARRRAGDYVGEMALVNREPRMATLIAVSEVRALCIDQQSFEGLLRDRPEVCLAIIRTLSVRLRESAQRLEELTNDH